MKHTRSGSQDASKHSFHMPKGWVNSRPPVNIWQELEICKQFGRRLLSVYDMATFLTAHNAAIKRTCDARKLIYCQPFMTLEQREQPAIRPKVKKRVARFIDRRNM